MPTSEGDGLETKLVDIGLEELEEQGIPKIEERKEGKYATLLHLTEEISEGLSKCLLSCYDMGGHTEYYNSQQVSFVIIFSWSHSAYNYKLTFFFERFSKPRPRHIW